MVEHYVWTSVHPLVVRPTRSKAQAGPRERILCCVDGIPYTVNKGCTIGVLPLKFHTNKCLPLKSPGDPPPPPHSYFLPQKFSACGGPKSHYLVPYTKIVPVLSFFIARHAHTHKEWILRAAFDASYYRQNELFASKHAQIHKHEFYERHLTLPTIGKMILFAFRHAQIHQNEFLRLRAAFDASYYR